jgi:DNA-binding FadR family transcriptional regulator
MRIAASGGRAAVFAPLDDGAVRSEAVVRRLGGAIALGLIDDGEQLPPEAELATSLRVAVVTLREALADLRRRGLVETRRGRGGGSFVKASERALTELSRQRSADLGSADLRELGEHHAAVAGTSARLAAERASAHDVERLRHTIETLAGASRQVDRRRIDGRHHIEIAAAAQSVRLTLQEIELQTELAELHLFPPASSGWAVATLTSHRAVLAAIEDRDGARARALTEERIAARTLDMIERHVARTVSGGGRAGDNGARRPNTTVRSSDADAAEQANTASGGRT